MFFFFWRYIFDCIYEIFVLFFFTVEFFVSLLFNSSLKYEYEREEFYPKMPPLCVEIFFDR